MMTRPLWELGTELSGWDIIACGIDSVRKSVAERPSLLTWLEAPCDENTGEPPFSVQQPQYLGLADTGRPPTGGGVCAANV